jgi:Zn-dependent M28 family amino/carboxypeptidase
MTQNPMKAWSTAALLALLPALAAAAPASPAAPADRPADRAAQEINAKTLQAPIRYLADDLLEGRGPATRADKLTQLYLATALQSLGLEPGAGKGSYIQPVDVVGVTSGPPESWEFRKGSETQTYKSGDQFIAASGVAEESSGVDGAEVVFVGYGIQAPEYKWDDFKGADLKGKVLLVMNNDPDWDPKLFEGNRRLWYGRWDYKYETAGRLGAAGAIIIHTTPSAGYGWQVVQNSWSVEQFQLAGDGKPRAQVTAWTTEEAARQLVKLGGFDLDALRKQAQSRDFKPVPLGITTSIRLHNKVRRVQSANVAGLLPGSDPKLKEEVVVYSAHHDHLGIGKPDATGDTIYNGAVDNATGVAQVLAIAKAYTALPERPKRSILFLFVAGEEKGLLGSLYYSLHPSIPPGRIAADINYDGGNILGRTSDVNVISLGKSSLDAEVAKIAATQQRTVVGDQFPEKGFFYRSDQFSFAKIGVPSIYLHSGTRFRGHPDAWGKEQVVAWEAKHYHQPSDQLTPDWNFDGMIEDARLGFYAGLNIANDPKLPTWNPGNEFEAARKAALAH